MSYWVVAGSMIPPLYPSIFFLFFLFIFIFGMNILYHYHMCILPISTTGIVNLGKEPVSNHFLALKDL
jgi:hypothetical protein